ncbi:golgin candidate 2 isoform X3 [Cynara cardunculus var. scolymus]|uniref:golgin candidate 2 isoform X3 n=1 Tax=Cynara cardunculus var. scolymus TaxID=59895 RepID=UPI000D62FF91|nr:golgin candidate 2 isoform X3 [Cynara cardunculus var. scolymus]
MSGWISSKLKVAETLLQQIDQQAAESLRKNEASRSDDDLSHAIPKKPSDILPPLKDQLKKKKKTPPEKSNFVGKLRNDGNLKVSGNEVGGSPNVNPKSSLTDSDWTELLSAPNKITSVSNGGVPRVPGLLKDGKRQVRSGSNLLALDRKRSQTVQNKSARRSDVVLGDKVNGGNLDGNQRSDSSDSTQASVGVQSLAENLSSEMLDFNPVPESDGEGKNEQSRFNSGMLLGNKISGFPITSSSSKTDSLSVSDGESNMETDSDSTSDSESEREKEERRKRREQLLAEKAAAKAIEAIKDRENLVARLEGEKQSLEKIIDERAKQQAQEASELQMTVMETMEAVDLEKQKHNNTRMEALMKLAKLETTNAELAKSLATAQWSLEVEVKRVAELHRQIELKEANHKGLTSKEKSHPSGNKLTASRGIELEHEILEAEHTFVTDKVGQLKEKVKTLETTINVTRKEIENPTEVEIELKRRLGQLTDHLIQKQAQVEALSSEKAMLMFRIEAVSRSLEESKSCLKLGDRPTNDLESGTWEPLFQERLRKGQKHIGSLVRQLDSIFLTGATFIRRNPMARIWSFAYLVCLHFWVLYIFRSQTAVSAGSGAVISLENINNTGV